MDLPGLQDIRSQSGRTGPDVELLPDLLVLRLDFPRRMSPSFDECQACFRPAVLLSENALGFPRALSRSHDYHASMQGTVWVPQTQGTDAVVFFVGEARRRTIENSLGKNSLFSLAALHQAFASDS